MKVHSSEVGGFHEGDMTPMIDMTFQLIAFFMVMIKFGEGEATARVRLPGSELAKPPQQRLEVPPVVLHLTRDGTVVLAGREFPTVAALRPVLDARSADYVNRNISLDKISIIIRGDHDAPTGKIQELIKACQEAKFESFSLRAKQEAPKSKPGGG